VEQVDLELLVKPLPLLSLPEADLLIGDEHDALGIVVFGARHVVEQLLLDGGRRLLSERK
jgi:hypothetical protein